MFSAKIPFRSTNLRRLKDPSPRTWEDDGEGNDSGPDTHPKSPRLLVLWTPNKGTTLDPLPFGVSLGDMSRNLVSSTDHVDLVFADPKGVSQKTLESHHSLHSDNKRPWNSTHIFTDSLWVWISLGRQTRFPITSTLGVPLPDSWPMVTMIDVEFPTFGPFYCWLLVWTLCGSWNSVRPFRRTYGRPIVRLVQSGCREMRNVTYEGVYLWD